MRFAHEQPGFDAFLTEVARQQGLPRSQVEKDYWITHILWALHASGLEVWFKGGTCLSKGYGIIERFSEDLDLKLESGTMSGLPPTPNWRGEKDSHIHKREEWFRAVAARLSIPDCAVALDPELEDGRWRSAVYEVSYPGMFLGELDQEIRPWIRLEVGSARVTPCMERAVTSWVHQELEHRGLSQQLRNNQGRVRCIHPMVTLWEKLDAIVRRWEREELPTGAFVRHYEDAARIIHALPGLPSLLQAPAQLLDEMLEARQIRRPFRTDEPPFCLPDHPRTEELRRSWNSINGLFWARRIPLEQTCVMIRGWLETVRTGRGSGAVPSP